MLDTTPPAVSPRARALELAEARREHGRLIQQFIRTPDQADRELLRPRLREQDARIEDLLEQQMQAPPAWERR